MRKQNKTSLLCPGGFQFIMYHPHNQYQSLLRTENIEPLVRTIEQLNTEVENNEAGLVELCRMLDNDFHFPTNVTTMNKTNSKEDPDDGDGALFYLIEQKYNLPRSVDDSREGRLQNLRNQVNHLIKLRETKIKKNKELLQLVHDYEDEVMLHVLPELRKKLDCPEDKDVILKLIDQKFQREADLFRKFIDKMK